MGPTLIPILSNERVHADHGWLKTFHTFAFQQDGYESWGPLRVLNEDRVEPNTGFGTHGHRDFEIFSYIVSGQLEHRDSMGNVEILRRGDLQMTSAGTGIRHSEKTNGDKQVHFLQIWATPTRPGLTPKYFTRRFPDKLKQDQWVKIVAPVGTEAVLEQREANGPAPVHSPLTVYAALIAPSSVLAYRFTKLEAEGIDRKGYIHVIQTSGHNVGASKGATIGAGSRGLQLQLKEGDGAFIDNAAGGEIVIKNIGDRVAELLLFDLQ